MENANGLPKHSVVVFMQCRRWWADRRERLSVVVSGRYGLLCEFSGTEDRDIGFLKNPTYFRRR